MADLRASAMRVKKSSVIGVALCCCSACVLVWVVLLISTPDDSVQSVSKLQFPGLDTRRPKPVVSLTDDVIIPTGKPTPMRQEAIPAPMTPTVSKNISVVKEPTVIPANAQLLAMSWAQLSELYHRYLSEVQITCSDIHRVGKVTDGGWDVCGDDKFVPKAPCIVYSFGIGDDFSFDDDVVRRYGCAVYSFDPSMKQGNGQRGAKSFFFRQGLADSDRALPNGWVMSRFDTFRFGLRHGKVAINMVKMDIEEWEWEVLPDLLTSDSLRTVSQLLIELHQCEGCSNYNPSQDKEPSRERYIHMLGLLSLLYQQNFRIFRRHQNMACRYIDKFTQMEMSACLEIGFVRLS